MGLDQTSVAATASYQIGTRLTLSFGAGGVLGGEATTDEARDVGAGAFGNVSGSYLAVYEREVRPFLLTSLTLAVSTTTAVSDDARRHRLTAGDLRVGLMVGKTFFDLLVPYAAARGFGGPVFWRLNGERITGSDRYRYTVGGGLTVRLPNNINAFIEVMPVGEQSGALGLSIPL